MKKLFTLFSLMLFYISGMLAANIANNTVIYFDATAYTDIQQSIASGKKLQMLLGHGSWSQGYQLTAVEGYDNLYSVKMAKWDGCTQLAFMTVDSQWGGEGSSVSNRVQWGYTKTPVYSITSNMSGNVGYAGNPLARTNNYTLPVKAPVITVTSALPEFPTTTVGETSTATVTYTLENAELAHVSVTGDVFSVEDAAGTITIIFAPGTAGEFAETLTISAGDVAQEIALSATAVEGASTRPEILNVTTPVFEETIVGETSTATVSYTLVNADAAAVNVAGEGFSIVTDELGLVTIQFAPEAAGTYNGTLMIGVEDVIKQVEFSATAVKAPVIVTISFVNPDWTEAAIWAWVEGGENLTGGTWPGKVMTKDETTGVFSYALTIPDDGVYNFIINNNNNGLQSVDMAGVTESTCYNLGAKSGEKYNLVVAENCDYTPAPEPEPIDPYVAIRGTMTNWDMANDIKMTYNADAANGPEWYITAFEVPADGKFKVVSVDAQSQATWYGTDKVDLQEGITNAGEGDGDIALPAGKYDIYFKVNEGRIWIQKYVEPIPEPDPVPALTVSAEAVTFEELTLGEEPVSATETITYTLENTEETATITLESEVFSAEDVDGTITITFAPTAAGEYTAELIIAAGEISETVTISGSAKDAPEEPEPSITVSATEVIFEELELGEEPVSATETISYTLENTEETATITLESEVFSAEDVDGTITITFAPTAAGEYTAELIIAAGEISEIVTISGSAKDAPEEPEFTTITIKVAAPTAWENCYLWAWYQDGTGNLYSDWPGAIMTKGEDGFYAIDVEIVSPIYFKVNAGQDQPESNNYEVGLAESACFNMQGMDLILNADCEYQEPTTIDPYVAIRGSMTEWDTNEITMTYNAEAENGPEWYVTAFEVPEDGEFKVVSVDENAETTWYGSDKVDLQEGITNAGEGDGNIKIPAGEYDIYFKVNEGRIWIQKYVDPVEPEPDNTITFTVLVPEGTIECYVTGKPLWDSGEFLKMEAVEGDANKFTITTTTDVLDGTAWKYCSGPGWSFVEKNDDGSEADNRTVAGNPDVVAKWALVYNPDAEPVEAYYAVRGSMTNWDIANDIKLTENAEGSEWYIEGLELAAGDEFKVVYVDENLSATWYGVTNVEANSALGENIGTDNITLAAGKYDIYFKVSDNMMWIQPASPSTDAEEAIAELIYAVDGTIFAPAPFAIIDLSGKDVTNANGSLQGTYIVKTQNSVAKISVQ